MWQAFKFKYGLFWTKQSIIESIVITLGIISLGILIAMASWRYYYATSNYDEVVVRSNYFKKLADSRERNLVSWLNGHPITSELSSDGMTKNVYFIEVKSLPFWVNAK